MYDGRWNGDVGSRRIQVQVKQRSWVAVLGIATLVALGVIVWTSPDGSGAHDGDVVRPEHTTASPASCTSWTPGTLDSNLTRMRRNG